MDRQKKKRNNNSVDVKKQLHQTLRPQTETSRLACVESGQKRRTKRRRRASCNDERRRSPLMFNEKQMSWLCKAGRMKRPWSESFPVSRCLYWQTASQTGLLQTDRPDERDSLQFPLSWLDFYDDQKHWIMQFTWANRNISKCLTAF